MGEGVRLNGGAGGARCFSKRGNSLARHPHQI